MEEENKDFKCYNLMNTQKIYPDGHLSPIKKKSPSQSSSPSKSSSINSSFSSPIKKQQQQNTPSKQQKVPK